MLGRMAGTHVSQKCLLCDTQLELIDLSVEERYLRCPDCSLIVREDSADDITASVYASDAYADAEWSTEYTDVDRLHSQMQAAASRMRWVETARKSGLLLDIGAAGGAFVKVAGEAGFRAMGVEPTPAFAEFARTQLHVDVRTGILNDADLGSEPFDVMTMWHVLEHIPNPLAELCTMHSRLAANGIVALEVPNIDSVIARKLGPSWSGLQPHVHVNQFTPTAIERLLVAAGFSDIRITTVSHGVYLTPLARMTSPGYLAHRIQLLRRGAHGISAPQGHEYLRALARR
jgi:2-polyprenyl-3-methyl-5-hydroxy-6-metoxy-1,4-benzoquinol methylase